MYTHIHIFGVEATVTIAATLKKNCSKVDFVVVVVTVVLFVSHTQSRINLISSS